VVRLEGEAKHYCQNISCPAQVKGRIEHFVAKRCMDIDGFGTKLVDQLVEIGLLHSIADIYSLELDKLAELDRMAEKSAQNIVDAVQASLKNDLWRLLHGLGIRNVGEHLSKLLAEHYGSLEALSQASIEELEAIHEVGPIVARGVMSFFNEDVNQRLIAQLKEYGLDPRVDLTANTEGKFAGLSFVFTGKLEQFNRDAAREMVETHGGKTAGSLSKKTDYLVAGPGAGSKLAKAEKLDVKVISESEFLEMVGAE
jgi:DNA ligase (NAD+)